MTVNGETLVLTHCGVRDTLWIEFYVASLYLPEEADPARALRDPGVPKLVRLDIVSTWALPDEVPEKYRRSEEHTSELQLLMRISHAVFCLKKNIYYSLIYSLFIY